MPGAFYSPLSHNPGLCQLRLQHLAVSTRACSRARLRVETLFTRQVRPLLEGSPGPAARRAFSIVEVQTMPVPNPRKGPAAFLRASFQGVPKNETPRRCSDTDLHVFSPRALEQGGALHVCREFIHQLSAQIRARGWLSFVCPFISITQSPEGPPADT